MMLTAQQLRSLDPGDQVEMGALFPKMAKEPIVWTVVETNHVDQEVTFDATYFGVNIGVFVARIRKEAVEWERVG